MSDAPSPQFGNWESDGNVPYTKYFDEVHKIRSEGNLGNSNDIRENFDAFFKDEGTAYTPPQRTGSDAENQKPVDEGLTRKEDGGRPSDSPLRHDIVARKITSESPLYQIGDRTTSGDRQRKARRTSGGGHDRSLEQSPLHPHYQVKYAVKGENSPPERKGSAEGNHALAPNTPVISKLRIVGQDDDTFEKSSAVPKFGEWDEKNPSSGDRFTDIFEKVREEKQGGSSKVPVITDDSIYLNGYNQDKNSTSMNCWCFSWCKN